MKVAAPGKLMLTGAYAVLEGAPAIVLAVDRYVVADTARAPTDPVRPEVASVARRLEAPAPSVDTAALEDAGVKLGLGSSAAGTVAAAGAILASRGVAFDEDGIARIRQLALDAHAEAQPRGSGADVAASAHGGVVEVFRADGRVHVAPTRIPAGVMIRAFSCGRPARTSDVLDRLAARRAEAAVASALAALSVAAHAGATACRCDDARAFVDACGAHAASLGLLGAALGLALVPAEVTRARTAIPSRRENPSRDDVVLLPSGAGGGDVVLWIGTREPTDHESRAFREASLSPLQLSISQRGVHALEASPSARN